MINILRRAYLALWLISMFLVLPTGIASFFIKPLLAWFVPMTVIVIFPVLIAFAEFMASGTTDKTIEAFIGRESP